MKPILFTFDVFGTVVDWRRGLEQELASLGRTLSPAEFERVMDAQGRDDVTRPHQRPGPARGTVANLIELAELARSAG